MSIVARCLIAQCFIDSPTGPLTLAASDHGLVALRWGDKRKEIVAPEDTRHPILQQATEELAAYFSRRRTDFSVPLDLRGTPFQQAVWTLLREIPYGQTTSYGALARTLGGLGKAQAVGLAASQNPIGIIVPCYRVIGKTGALTGFAGGLETKAFLLEHERGPDAAPAFARQGRLF